MTDSPQNAEPAELDDSNSSALSRKLQFRCAQCGAAVSWNPDRDALTCEYCGAERAVPRAANEIREHALAEAGSAARGLGVERKAVACGECGATFSFDASVTSQTCVFCGSSNVLAQDANRNALRPESLIPLDVGRAKAEENFRRWIGGLWFRPEALKRLRDFDAVGIYVPCWTFDASAHSDWSADAGYYYYETAVVPVMVNGRLTLQTRQVQKVRWEPAWGARDDVYDDLLVHASKGLPEELAKKLGAFDMAQLVPYRPEYLAGWRAEEYQIDLAGGWNAAKERIIASQQARCAGDVPGDTHRSLRVANQLSDVRWKHILLPIWTLAYRHEGKSYTVLIHGQTGRVEGHAPISALKILVLIVVVAVALFAVLAIGGMLA